VTPTCIVSCCHSEGRRGYYDQYADRLEASLDQHAVGIDRFIWRDTWPTGSKSHKHAHYAFKWHAIENAFAKGYRYAIWLDAGTQLLAPIRPLMDKLELDGYALLRGGDVLGEWISDAALDHFGFTREQAMGMKLAGGCLVGIDRENPTAMKFYEKWGELARDGKLFMCHHTEQSVKDRVMRSVLVSDGDGSVISHDPRVKGHRSDEACFSLMAERYGMKFMSLTDWYKIARTY
jgi:hypothetical protein